MRALLLPALLFLAACTGEADDAPPAGRVSEAGPIDDAAPLETVVDSASGETVVMGAAQVSNEVVAITQMQPGDRACYLTVQGDGGERQEMADFEFCERDDLVGQRVTLTTVATQIQAESCGGDPECTDTERVQLVTAADLADE